MGKTPVILDCDPGQDDAIMLMLAFANRDVLDILGVTTVGGNVTLDKTSRNARIIAQMTGNFDIPIFAGCDQPLKRALFSAADVHGAEGINGIDIFEPDIPLATGHGVEFIIKSLKARAGEKITIVVTGPATNITTALLRAPEIKAGIERIVLMGGAREMVGNVAPSAEFNMYVDPDAAAVLYKSGVPITTIGLDVTHKVLATKERLQPIQAIKNDIARAVANVLGPYSFYDQNRFGLAGAPLHDPCTIAYVLAPKLFSTQSVNLEVETESPLTLGHTVVDVWGRTNRSPNTDWAYDVDVDGVFALLYQALKAYDGLL